MAAITKLMLGKQVYDISSSGGGYRTLTKEELTSLTFQDVIDDYNNGILGYNLSASVEAGDITGVFASRELTITGYEYASNGSVMISYTTANPDTYSIHTSNGPNTLLTDDSVELDYTTYASEQDVEYKIEHLKDEIYSELMYYHRINTVRLRKVNIEKFLAKCCGITKTSVSPLHIRPILSIKKSSTPPSPGTETYSLTDNSSEYDLLIWFVPDSSGKYVYNGSRDWDGTFYDDPGIDRFRIGDIYYYSESNHISVYSDTSIVNSSSTRSMFSGLECCTRIDLLEDIDTSESTNMSRMFYDCGNLTSLDVSKLDTTRVIDMSDMFSRCHGLTSLDVSMFNTSKVTNMDGMFYGCSKLTSLDLSNFNTSKVTGMRFMFSECEQLSEESIHTMDNWNLSSCTDFYQMFRGCKFHPNWDGTFDEDGTFTPNSSTTT